MSEKLTIAQALRRIKKLKGQIAEHTQRAEMGVSYVSTKVPAFRFKEEFEAMKKDQTEMLDLQARVAVANATATVKDGENTLTLSKAVRQLEEIKGEIAFLKRLNLRSETIQQNEMFYDEVKGQNAYRRVDVVFVSDLSEQDRDQQVKALQDRFEALNNAVEDANHSVVV